MLTDDAPQSEALRAIVTAFLRLHRDASAAATVRGTLILHTFCLLNVCLMYARLRVLAVGCVWSACCV